MIESGEGTLVGRRATRQLLATAAYADGSVRDFTRPVTWTSLNPEVATVSAAGPGRPQG